MVSIFQPGQLVRISDFHSMAYGRYGRVVSVLDNKVAIKFADMLGLAALKFPFTFERSQLEIVEGVPDASFYLLVTMTTVANRQVRKHCAIAHGQAHQSPYNVAATIAAKFFDDPNIWDGSFYFTENPPSPAELVKFELITAADYASLRRTTLDYNLGYEVRGCPS